MRVLLLPLLFLVPSSHAQYDLPRFQEQQRAALRGERGSVLKSVAFSPDGKLLATTCGDRTVKVWDVAAEKVAAALDVGLRRTYGAVFSPDGSRLLADGEPSTVWDVKTWKQAGTLEGLKRASSLAYSPDGKLIVAVECDLPDAIQPTRKPEFRLGLWDASTFKKVAGLEQVQAQMNYLAVSPDGKLAATAGYGEVLVWNLAGRKLKARLGGHDLYVSCVAFSPDGKTLLSGGRDKRLVFWDVDTLKERKRVPFKLNLGGLKGPIEVYRFAFSPDGKTIAVADEGTPVVHFLDADTGTERAWRSGHIDTLTCVAFSPDGKTLATGAGDKSVLLWDVPPVKE